MKHAIHSEWPGFVRRRSILLTIEAQFSSGAQSGLTLCHPMDCSSPGLPVHHQLPEFTQTHVHGVSDAIQPSHPLLSPSPPALNRSQHQGRSWEEARLWWKENLASARASLTPGHISTAGNDVKKGPHGIKTLGIQGAHPRSHLEGRTSPGNANWDKCV